ncbi:CgeB family protein [Desulfovulcanus sp.]
MEAKKSVDADDIVVDTGEQKIHLLGRYGLKRINEELQRLCKKKDVLLVLVGSGTKAVLRVVSEKWSGPVAVVDKEDIILDQSRAFEEVVQNDNFYWVNEQDVSSALKKLTAWQSEHGYLPFYPLIIPAYLRIDPDYYKQITAFLKASHRFNFWERARYKKFVHDLPRILLITSKYFLMGEVIAVCKRLGIPHHLLQLEDQEIGCEKFVRDFLQAVVEFKPDFVFTINHLGVDREGVLIELLEKLELPLASWFVDNPHLILYLYNKLNSPWTTIFTWDADNIEELKARGFENVYYLPLACDTHRFRPDVAKLYTYGQQDIAFVGNSMFYKVNARLKKIAHYKKLVANYHKVAKEFLKSKERSVNALLKHKFPAQYRQWQKLPDIEKRLDYETMITWEATRIYRELCVQEILPFSPLIAGDRGWLETFGSGSWRWQPELSYYKELPGFYPCFKINFNCTSAQMKGAVNQRVFDVPATGSFLLTDYRYQIENLFVPGKEVVFYRDRREINDLVKFYLARPEKREQIARAAYERVIKDHTYEKRMQFLCEKMKRIYRGKD